MQWVIYLMILPVIFASCSLPKNAYYFKDLQRDTSINTPSRGAELKIRKNDVLQINISSLNPAEDMIYNAAAGSGAAGSLASVSNNGYVVDGGGQIQLHKLGSIKVEGMTRAGLKDKIQNDMAPYLKDPVVTVRFQNHKITVLGEVNQPQVIPMPEEQLSILEVLGISGDVSQLARRDNILVIRETENGKEFKRLNLEDKSIFTSSWFWLQPGDVVYVEPNDVKLNEAKRAQRTQNISIGLSAISVIIIVLNTLIK